MDKKEIYCQLIIISMSTGPNAGKPVIGHGKATTNNVMCHNVMVGHGLNQVVAIKFILVCCCL